MGLLIPTLKWTGLNSSLMISLCVSLSCSLSFSLMCTHTHHYFHNRKNRTFKSDLLVSRFAQRPVKKHLTDWAAKNKSVSTNRKQLERLQRQQVQGYTMSTCVGFSVKLSLQQQHKPPRKFGGAAQAGAGGDGGDGGVFWRTRAGCGVEPERAK